MLLPALSFCLHGQRAMRLVLSRPKQNLHSACSSPLCPRAGTSRHPPCTPLPSSLLQKAALAAIDKLLADAPRRSALLCDSSKDGEDGG